MFNFLMGKWSRCVNEPSVPRIQIKVFFKENAFGDLRPKLFFEERIKIEIQIRADGRRIKKLEIYFGRSLLIS